MTKPYFLNSHKEDDLQWKMTSNYKKKNIPPSGIWIGEVEYLSNHLLDPTQILNLSLDDQTILYNYF